MQDLLPFIPELILVVSLAGMIAGEVAYHGENTRLVTIISLLGLLAAGLNAFLIHQAEPYVLMQGKVTIDGVANFFRLFFVGLAFLTVLHTRFSKEIPRERTTEYFVFLTAAALAMCLVASATDLLVLFLSLQMVNLIAYFLVGYNKLRSTAAEAAIKYMIFSIVSAALVLYGASLIFARTHSLNLYDIQKALIENPMPVDSFAAVFVLMFTALSFYLGVFPFYQWLPDVFVGAPTPTSVFLGVGLPATGIVVGMRLFLTIFSTATPGTEGKWAELGGLDWTMVIATSAAITMVVGSLLGVVQESFKRMLGCLVIAQSGMLLLGLVVLDRAGLTSLLFSLIVSLFGLVGLGAAFSYYMDRLETDRLDQFKGAIQGSLFEAVCLAMFFACFIGLPPFPGVVARFLVVGAAVQHRWYFVAVLAIVASVLGIAAFARVAFALTGEGGSSRLRAQPTGHRVFLAMLLVPTLLLTIVADPVLRWVMHSIQLILW